MSLSWSILSWNRWAQPSTLLAGDEGGGVAQEERITRAARRGRNEPDVTSWYELRKGERADSYQPISFTHIGENALALGKVTPQIEDFLPDPGQLGD